MTSKAPKPVFFICKNQIPNHKHSSYGRICCNYHPQKDESHCIHLTMGGDHIINYGNKSTPTAYLITTKLLINSTISTPLA